MKKHKFLQEAIGLIDDDLLTEAETAKPTKRASVWIKWCAAAAACFILVVGCTFLLRDADTPTPGNLSIAENLWQKEDFNAYSLSYKTMDAVPLRSEAAKIYLLSDTTEFETQITESTIQPTESETLTSTGISITQAQTIKFETLVAQRYAVYRSPSNYPIFYDTQQDREVDLQERILGDTSHLFEEMISLATQAANTLYPGMLDSEHNRDLFRTYLYYCSLDLPVDGYDSMIPDTEFMDKMEESWDSEELKRIAFFDMCWSSYFEALKTDSDIFYAPYRIEILGIDSANGICIVRVRDIVGNGWEYLSYDIKTDVCQDLRDNTGNSLIGTMLVNGYSFNFSADGSIATIAFADAAISGGNLIDDITQRGLFSSISRNVQLYNGEELGVFFLDGGTSYLFKDLRGASELFISEYNSVLYFKKMNEENAGKSFLASDSVWYNRLKLINRDTDQWVFQKLENDRVSGRRIILQGNFVRFAAEETVVIMERGGSYFAYALETGRDITDEIKTGSVTMYTHEQIVTYLENGRLYRKNIFTDSEPEPICEANEYILSSDEAFAFTYRTGDNHVTCYNIATLESCRIDIDSQMSTQLFGTDGAVLQMNYNEAENTLLLSFYVEADIGTENDSDVDFYALLEKMDDTDTITETPADPVVITDLTVSREIVEEFREYSYYYDHPDGVIYWYTYYPTFLDMCETRFTIFQKLGLETPDDSYLDVKGTRFILYEDEDDLLTLTFYEGWELYDYDDFHSGFCIDYRKDGTKNYRYDFLVEEARIDDSDDRPN